MHRLLALFILSIPFYSVNAMVRTGVEVTEVQEVDDDGEVEEVWVGPGWYYGVWFDTEVDYHNWHRHHHHGGYHGGHHGGHHHGGGHGRHH